MPTTGVDASPLDSCIIQAMHNSQPESPQICNLIESTLLIDLSGLQFQNHFNDRSIYAYFG